MYSKIIDDYISTHTSSYKAKYCYHSVNQIDETTWKFHYYRRDARLLQIDIFLVVYLEDKVRIVVHENLHEREEWALACDALERVRQYTNHATSIKVNEMRRFVSDPKITTNIKPQDMINVLNFLEYHFGKNPDSIYDFYKIYIPYLKQRLEEHRYREALKSLNYLFDEILFEEIWTGINARYLDQEYLMHQAYARSIFNYLDKHMEGIVKEQEERVASLLEKLFGYWRFAFSIFSSLDLLYKNHVPTFKEIFEPLGYYDDDHPEDEAFLVFKTLRASEAGNVQAYRENIKKVLELLRGDILEFMNYEEQMQTGLVFLQHRGFDLLLDMFDDTHDAYLYKCFPITQIPKNYHSRIEQQLRDALNFYANYLKAHNYNSNSAFNQLFFLNTLLIEHFNVDK